jgi:ABC-2 type transport system ATP-binding protein
VISVEALTKRYGATSALEDVSCEVVPGRVTGLLGPNGAGKSTLLRVAVGLDHPSAGRILVEGVPYAELAWPLRVVGAHLGGRPWHPRRSARQHLVALARTNRIALERVDEVLGVAGLGSVGRRRTGGYSLGMAQRLGLASALLGEPRVLLLDEPVNGLDTDGVRWIRSLLRSLAEEGRVVLVSSHLMTEMQLVADQVIVLGRGHLLADVPTAVLAHRGRDEVCLVTRGAEVAGRLASHWPLGAAVESSAESDRVTFRVRNISEADVGEAAFRAGVSVLHLSTQAADLEAGYLDLVAADGEFTAHKEHSDVW